MKQATHRILGIVALSALLIGTGGVFARGGFGPGWGGHHGMLDGRGFGGPMAYQVQNLDRLKTTLGITPDQETAWNTYAEAVKGKADLRASHRQAMAGGTVTPDERLAFRQQGLAQMQKVIEAKRGLYAVLTPEQQARAGSPSARRCRRW